MKFANQEAQDDLLLRLRNIRGHIMGIEKMIQEGKSCIDVLTQMVAVRASIEKVAHTLMEEHAQGCLEEGLASGKDPRELTVQVVKTVLDFMR
ncbi:MAG: metal-sensitive transcriptional regulator [Syntrophothermus sp.]